MYKRQVDQASAFQTDQAPAAMRQTLVVGNQDQGGTAFAVEFEEQIADPLAGGAVEVAGG